ncbi:MAG TPA: nucleotide exchange factor GrpE [Lachnospiraceae bacterium]|nr:nucleotide exchange factor GrpE [Lachnospiraceae bacterium]
MEKDLTEDILKDMTEEHAEESIRTEGEEAEAVQTEAGQSEAEEEPADEKSEESETGEETGEEKAEENKKYFGRKDKKEKKDKKDEMIEDLTDKVKRQMAEFDNFRKRTEKEKSLMYEMGVKSVVEKLLPVIDNFERGLQTVPEEEKDSSFVEGMNMIYKQLSGGLEQLGVKQIEAVGKEFDPNFHNAVMQVESEEYESGTVAQELQKGYTYRDMVVRHSMVGVVG